MTSFTIGDQNEVHGRAMKGLSDKIDTLHAKKTKFREEAYALRAAGDELAGAVEELKQANLLQTRAGNQQQRQAKLNTIATLRRWREATGN